MLYWAFPILSHFIHTKGNRMKTSLATALMSLTLAWNMGAQAQVVPYPEATETAQTDSDAQAPDQHQFPLHSQKTGSEFKLDATGFIRYDALYNTRQSVGVREGLLYFYPKPEELNADGFDENSVSELNMLSVFTRGALKMTAPRTLGAQISGLVEADFFGHLNSTISNLRLRHAYVNLEWDRVQLRLGQYWDLLTHVDFFPGVLNPGAGQPLQPFARQPGAYLRWQALDFLELDAGVSMQRDAFAEFGARNELQQNSGLPSAGLNLNFKTQALKAGFGFMGEAIRPALSEENLYGGALQAFAHWRPVEPLRVRARGVWGTNMASHQMLGGFVHTDDDRYLNLASWSTWLDVDYALNKQWKLGVFGGYTANLGTLGETATAQEFIARDPNMAHVFFVVPRLIFQASKNLRFALEVHWTEALYASAYTSTLRPDPQAGDAGVSNVHLAFVSMLMF